MAYDVDAIKAMWPLPRYCLEMGIELRGSEGAQRSRCPVHHGENPEAFSVFMREGKWYWRCHTGDCGGGDVITLDQKLHGDAFEDACRRLGGQTISQSIARLDSSRPRGPLASPPPEKRANPSTLSVPTLGDLKAISNTRHLSLEGLGLAARRGFLRITQVHGHRCWVVGERDGRTAAARRLDGGLFSRGDGSEYKSHALTGKSWPLGLGQIPEMPSADSAILGCEGEGDFLAAFHFMALWGEPNLFPVALLGRTHNLRPEAVARLQDWRIRIFPHADADEGGLRAAERWAACIPGAKVDVFDFRGLRMSTGEPVNDLNDCSRIHPEDAPALEPMNPLPPRHPCDDKIRLDFDYENLFRIKFWQHITGVSSEGWPIAHKALCPF